MEFLVLQTTSVPALGSSASVSAYRGDHATPKEAAEASVAVLNLRVNQRVFVISGPAYLPYTVTPEVREG
jgi:hypothetical protein